MMMTTTTLVRNREDEFGDLRRDTGHGSSGVGESEKQNNWRSEEVVERSFEALWNAKDEKQEQD
eukprot:765022-Hanusia_phi.AAC.1